MSYLVDTDWIINGLHGRPEALAVLEEHRDDGLGVSIITLGEVYEGAYNNPEFLALFTVLPLTEDTMRHFARLRALLRKQGNLIPDLDLLIAVTALEHELVLLTRNRRHFERVPDLRLY